MKPSWIALLLLLGAAPLAAQNTVTGVRPLAFGVVMRGTTNTVLPSDPIRSGRFYIRYRLNDQVRLNFTLPNTLARVGGGATMSINFTNQSAIAQGTAGNSVPVTFNAHSPITFTLTTAGATWLAARTMAVLRLSSSCAESCEGGICWTTGAGSA